MAFRINLDAGASRHRLPRIVVLGVRFSDTPAAGKKHLESLLDDHLHSRAGFELLTQGTATNNTDEESTGFIVHGDPGEAFDTGFRERPAFTTAADPLLRRDGEWFAQLLGISPALVQRMPNAGARTSSSASNAPRALAGHHRLHDADDVGAGVLGCRRRRHEALLCALCQRTWRDPGSTRWIAAVWHLAGDVVPCRQLVRRGRRPPQRSAARQRAARLPAATAHSSCGSSRRTPSWRT